MFRYKTSLLIRFGYGTGILSLLMCSLSIAVRAQNNASSHVSVIVPVSRKQVMAEGPEGLYRSQFDEAGYYNPNGVFLQAGAPGTDVLTLIPDLMQRATAHRMVEEKFSDAQLFQYGAETGNAKFKLAMSSFLSNQYGEAVYSQDLILTNGASMGLWLILTLLFNKGDPVFVEEPTYNYAMKSFKDHGLNIISVDSDDEGIDATDLENKLQQHILQHPQQHDKGHSKSALLYLIPVFHNPTGRVMSPERCNQVIKLARQYDLLVVADDVYNLLNYDQHRFPPKRLFAYDNRNDSNYTGSVISSGTFSKFAGPGLRLGWMEAPNWFVKLFATRGPLQSGGGVNTYTSGVMASAINLGILQEHIRFVRQLFRVKMLRVTQLLKQFLPRGSKLSQEVSGGYFLWVELPENIDAEEFRKFSTEKYQIDFAPGKKYSASGKFRNFMRICFTFYPLEVLEIVIPQLCKAIEEYHAQLSN